MVYTVIDVETTGKRNRITEISIFRYDNDLLIDEFTSLVNPESLIPDYITALTGIDDYMVAKAPLFSEIAETILSITKDAIFVAHSVNFDYNVIRNEFKSIGINFNRKKLCTVRLSRKLLPGHKSYSLGKLCDALNIPIHGRHRARGDAEATVVLFKNLLIQPTAEETIQSFFKRDSKEATLPQHLKKETYDRLPVPLVFIISRIKKARSYMSEKQKISKSVYWDIFTAGRKRN